MKLDSGQRVSLFTQGRALSPILGDLFQNPMDVDHDTIQSEIHQALIERAKNHDAFSAYIKSLRNLQDSLQKG